MEYVLIDTIIFTGKRKINWDAVEAYLKRFSGKIYKVKEYGDEIIVSMNFADEFTGSKCTRGLRGSLARVKANVSQIIPRLIETATNRRWSENHEEKHSLDAKGGWYRYDSFFSMPVENKTLEDDKRYRATLLVRKNDNGNYLHDVVNIKKEAGNPQES